jgi:hypothetical protein
MKRYLVPVEFASFVALSLVLAVPAQGQFGGQKRGGSQQSGGMQCGKGQGGGGSQTPFGQSSSTMRTFGQNTGVQYPYAQYTGMQYPYTQNNAMQYPYAQNTPMQYPYAQNTGMQYPYTQNTGMLYPNAQNTGMQYPYTQNTGMLYPYTQTNTANSTAQNNMQIPLLRASSNNGRLDAAQMQYLMQYQAGTTSAQSNDPTTGQPDTSVQRIQQRRAADQSTNVQLLRRPGQ